MDILAVCVHVAEQGNVQLGRPALSIGAGPAGNGVAQLAMAIGVGQACFSIVPNWQWMSPTGREWYGDQHVAVIARRTALDAEDVGA